MPDLEPTRRERKKDETRERITAAARELFTKGGFEATTVDEIAQRADVAKGTFFNYFARKEAVFDAIFEQRATEMESVTTALLADDLPFRHKLRRFVHAITSRHMENKELSRLAVMRMLTRTHDPVHGMPAIMRGYLTRLIAQGQEHGELRADVDPARAAALIQGAAIGTTFAWLCSPQTFDLDQELQERLALILDGLAVPTRASS